MQAIELRNSGTKNFYMSARMRTVAGIGVAIALLLGLGVAPASAETVLATYSCTTTILGQNQTFTSPVSITTTTPSSVAGPGSTVKMTDLQITFTLPQSLVEKAQSYGVTWISGKITTFDVHSTDASPTTVNMAGTGIDIPKTNLPSPAQTMKFTLHFKTVGSWTASAKGTMIFKNGTFKFTLNDNLGVSQAVTGSPHPAVTLAETTVN